MNRILFILLIIVFASCSKKAGKDDNPDIIIKDTSKINLHLTDTLWFLSRSGIGGGNVNLKIAGSTNGDRVTVRTFGDGVRYDLNLDLDSKKSFIQNIVISFTATSLPVNEFIASTKVVAYKDTSTLTVLLYSGKLKY